MCPRSAPCRQGACVPLNNELADVAVQRVSFRPQEVLSGQAITVDLRVANLGRADAAPLSCEIFATANNPRPDRDFFLGSAPIEFLAAGEEFSGAVRATVSAPPGRYRVYAACDRDNFIPESNEDNNLRIADLALTVRDDGQPRPDLIWSELFIERDGVQEGESAPIYGVICNQGDGDAFEVGVEVIVESASGRGERVSLGEQFFGGVPAGACLDFRFDSNPIPCPSDREPLWLVTGLVDPFNLIEESAEDNNLINNQQVLFVECGPDDCQGDRFDPADVNAPPLISPGRYDLALCSGDVDAFRLDLQAGDIARGLIQINEPLPIYAQLLAEGAPEPLLVGVEVFDAVEFQTEPVPASGRYLLLIEPLSPESVTYTFEYEIERGAALPDLVVSDLSVGLVVDPNGRQLFSYTFNVTNRGRAVAASVVTTVQLADPLGEVVDGSDNNTNQMLPGQSQRFAGRALVPLMPSAGVYTLIVTADATNRLRESDEANNTLRAQRELGGQPQGCADALDPNDTMEQPAEIDEGQYEGLQICAQDNNDYYLLCPPMGATAMNITVNFQHSRGDIDMTLFNEERRRVAQANGVRDTEQILYTDLRGGCYTLRVYLFGNGAAATTTPCSSASRAATSSPSAKTRPSPTTTSSTPLALKTSPTSSRWPSAPPATWTSSRSSSPRASSSPSAPSPPR
jgi:hypothetical protein